MKVINQILLALVAVALSLGLIFGLGYFGLSLDRFFMPRQEALRYQVYRQSQSYNEGMVRDLDEIRDQYLSATPEQKEALRSIAIHRFEVYPYDRLPPDLQLFYNQLKGQQ